jgi:hypothetical protein
MKIQQSNLDTVIQNALSAKDGKRMPIFDPANFEIVKTTPEKEITGFYLGRWEQYKDFYKLDQKLKGNGYMIAGEDGIMWMIPDWKSLENKMKMVELGLNITVVIVEIISNEKDETFVKTAVFRN